MTLRVLQRKLTFHGFFREHSTGCYGTVLFHLGVVIILLSAKLYSIGTKEISIMLDFSEPDPKELQQRQEQQRAMVMSALNRQIANRPSVNVAEVRNVAVNVAELQNQPLRDDRNTNTNQLYDEARQVQDKLNAARQQVLDMQGADDVARPSNKPAATATAVYQGPSVIRYELGNRKAFSLPVPAYQCLHGGDIKVLIEADRRGYVKTTKIDVPASSSDRCLQEAAVTMARLSRFEVDAAAPNRQAGYIIYRFFAQ
ncbi:MAG: hypothetical protein LBD91_07995 [Prevotellaceae bacterium]|jgi:hypothetical protein|nr:hypothetical protein [Prevotellaceae bacterium]